MMSWHWSHDTGWRLSSDSAWPRWPHVKHLRLEMGGRLDPAAQLQTSGALRRARCFFPGTGACRSWCYLEVLAPGHVVLVTESRGNPGSSVTQEADKLASLVSQALQIPPVRLVWVEQYEGRQEFDQAFFRPGPDGTLFIKSWVRLERKLVGLLPSVAAQVSARPDLRVSDSTWLRESLRAGPDTVEYAVFGADARWRGMLCVKAGVLVSSTGIASSEYLAVQRLFPRWDFSLWGASSRPWPAPSASAGVWP